MKNEEERARACPYRFNCSIWTIQRAYGTSRLKGCLTNGHPEKLSALMVTNL